MTPSMDLKDAKNLDQFLSRPRLGTLSTNRQEGTPMAVPVWFDWDGSVVRMFSASTAAKVRRLQNDARASLLVTNHLDEPENWVAFDGKVTLSDQGGIDLAERLAPRYWDLEDPGRRETLELWRKGKDFMRLLTLDPRRIRTGH